MHLPRLALACLLLVGCGPAAPPGGGNGERLATLLGSEAADGFEVAAGAREFVFPRDHGPHEGYRNEWWYVTGNLDAAGGRRFGFELTLFRFLLEPEPPERVSDWSTNAVMVGHVALTDVAEERFLAAERFARDAAGLAGATVDPVRIWLYDWTLRRRHNAEAAGTWQLKAETGDFALDLSLLPLKGPVLQGEGGLSQKSAEPGNASWYYSVPRLKTTGVVELGDERFDVAGLSWLDREWSTSALGPGQSGWDWFALQLSDGSELMFYQLRRRDGSRDPYSAGKWIGPDGDTRSLAADAVRIEVLDTWESPRGGSYPARWRIEVPAERLVLAIRPVLADQELDTFVRYWEGAVDVTGTRGTQGLDGRGYVELTGYASGDAPPRP